MVRFTISSVLLAVLISGCDPFAPGDPEAPTVRGNAQGATRAETIPALWSKGIAEENTIQTLRLLDLESFQGTSGGATFPISALEVCLDKLASEGVDSASFSWRNSPSGTTDSVTGDVDWMMVKVDGARFGGRLTWGAVRDDAAEWRIARWSEPATSGNWSDACGGL